jgi:hypothetical protein
MTDFRISRAREIREFFKQEILKRDLLLLRLKRCKNISSVIHKLSASVTVTTGVSGIAVSSTVIMLPATIGLESLSIISGITTLVSSQIGDCVAKKIMRHKEIKLLCLDIAENINKIIAESDDITQDEFELISNYIKNTIRKKLKFKINI